MTEINSLLVAAAVAVAGVAAAAFVLRARRERGVIHGELAGVQARVGGLVESAMDAIVTVDMSQRVLHFNAAAESMFLWPRHAIVGQPLERLIPERFRTAHHGHVDSFAATAQTSRGMGNQTVLYGLRADGSEFPLEASISKHEEGGELRLTAILRDVTERVRAHEALQRSQQENQSLALAANGAREQEKSRIARELHDELGQALTALKIDVGWLREHAAPSPQSRDKLEAMQALLDSTVAAARRISADLRPMMLDDLGLVAASEWLVQNFTQRHGIACELVMGGGDLDLPDPHATTVFRTLQESLTNAAKHSRATQVEVAIERVEGEIVLTVSDNGVGFSREDGPRAGSFGHLGLRERAGLLGGSVLIESEPGRGTRVELRIPEPKQAPS